MCPDILKKAIIYISEINISRQFIKTVSIQTYNLDIVRHFHELKPLLNQPLPLFVLDEVALVALQEDGQLGQTAEEQGREGRG